MCTAISEKRHISFENQYLLKIKPQMEPRENTNFQRIYADFS